MPDDQRLAGQAGFDATLKAYVPPVLMALGAFTLLRTSRLLSLGLLGLWAYDIAAGADGTRKTRGRDVGSRRLADQAVDAAVEDSFPASDPPSYSGSTAGAP